jgi:hypothetical protein
MIERGGFASVGLIFVEGSAGILPALDFLEMRARRPRSHLSAERKPRLRPLFSDPGVLQAGCLVPVWC